MTEEFSPDTFEPLRGTSFTVIPDAEVAGAELLLAQLVEHPSIAGAPRARPFTLTFLGPAQHHLPQRTYRLGHPALGQIAIFLVPVGPRPDGQQQYEAVFN